MQVVFLVLSLAADLGDASERFGRIEQAFGSAELTFNSVPPGAVQVVQLHPDGRDR
jgi:hypothetical protein